VAGVTGYPSVEGGTEPAVYSNPCKAFFRSRMSLNHEAACALRDWRVAAARYRLKLLESCELPDLATTALVSGLDGRSLRLMAGEQSPTWADSGPLFELALAELSLIVPERLEAGWMLARHYSEQIMSGAISPYEGARSIWHEVAGSFDQETEIWQRFAIFVGLASEWEDYPPGRSEFDRQILHEAARVLQGDALRQTDF
jgi:hypothetical protein